ncbi:MAG: AtpZ/AtpI family protein [Oscillospiraceae bacterium]|nr:AtpZ/AtpI family protein [Oscillospiraceae bacterium]
MKILNLILWVGQFGFSIIFPSLFFLLLAVWLQQKFSLGMWIVVVFGLLGVLTSVSTAKSCLRALQKAAEEASDRKEPPLGFNDHT